MLFVRFSNPLWHLCVHDLTIKVEGSLLQSCGSALLQVINNREQPVNPVTSFPTTL